MKADIAVLEANIEIRDTMATHLFMCSIIYVGWGLNYDFIWAWKSGRKPSASRDTKSRTIPIICDSWVLVWAYGSK